MTDDTIPMPAGEEPVKPEMPATQTPGVDEMPTMVTRPGEVGDATQTVVTDVPADQFAAAPGIPPTVRATPHVALGYEQFGAPTAAAQPLPYPATPVSTQLPQASNPVVSYPQYSAQPGQPFSAPAGYAQYPGQPGAPVPVVKKRRTFLWVAIVIVVVLLLGGGTVFAFTSIQAKTQAISPSSTLQTYCHAVKAGDAQSIYGLLSQQARAHTSIDDLQQKFKALNALSSLGMKYSDCTFSNLQVSGSLAVATVSLTTSMTFQGQTMSIADPSLVSLVLENNQWKIDFSSLAQPQPNVQLPNFPTPTVSSH